MGCYCNPELKYLVVQMFPYKTSLKIDKKSGQALYVQLSNQFIELISNGQLTSGAKLMSSRVLAELLSVHRKTVVACYEDLAIQGWVETIPKKGTFVHQNLPLLQKQKLNIKQNGPVNGMNFPFYTNEVFGEPFKPYKEGLMYTNDGISDSRLTPLDEISRTYRRIMSKKSTYKYLSYDSTYGNEKLRDVLVNYLNETRGLHITKNNLIITRGSQMGIYLSSQLLLRENDVIIIGNTNYSAATKIFQYCKASIKTVSVDKNGIDTDEVEKLCKKYTIKALYVTSHHHHPTTVTLSAERRIKLLNLAQKYNFAIIEDDYDYDFNYNHSPILPLASYDVNKNVIYIGSVCKTVAPVFRIGHLIASESFVDEISKLRRFIDRQGDALLELVFADFIKSGNLDRHIRKIVKIYKSRRDLFCELLKKELSDFFSFEIPIGGMAVWIQLNKKYTWEQVAKEAKKYQLEILNYQNYDLFEVKHNSMRIGFATYNEYEIRQLVSRLKMIKRELM